MSSSQTTGEVRPDDGQIRYFLCQNGGFGPPSATLGSGGARRDGSALSKTPNSRKLASKLQPTRGIPDEALWSFPPRRELVENARLGEHP